MTLGEMWRRLARGGYVRVLEAEVDRLRAENRALLNSILGIAGIPPIFVMNGNLGKVPDGVDFAKATGTNDVRLVQQHAGGAVRTGAGKRPFQSPNLAAGITAAPMRRRSWHQIHRALELESVKRAKSE